MRTQGINLHVAHHCFFLPSFISSPPSPSLETKNRKRRRIWKRLKTSRRISGERLSIETILQIIDRSVKKKKKKGGEGWKRRRESYALARYFRERIPFPRVTLDAPFSTRNSSREKERKRGKERERAFSVAGGRWFMDENRGWNKRRRENISSRELIVCRIFIQYSFRIVSCAFTWFISANFW